MRFIILNSDNAIILAFLKYLYLNLLYRDSEKLALNINNLYRISAKLIYYIIGIYL